MDQVVRVSAVNKLIDTIAQSASEKLLHTQCPDYTSYMRLYGLHAAASQLRFEFNQFAADQLRREED